MGFASGFGEAFSQSYGQASSQRASRLEQEKLLKARKEESEYEWRMKGLFDEKEKRTALEKKEREDQAQARVLAEQTGKPLKDVYARLKDAGYAATKDWAENTVGGPSTSTQSIDDEMAGSGIAAAESPVDRLIKAEGGEVPTADANAPVNQPQPSESISMGGGYHPAPKVLKPEEQIANLKREFSLATTSPERKTAIEAELRGYGQANDIVNPPRSDPNVTKVGLVAQIATETDPQRKAQLQSALDTINTEEANSGKLADGAVRGVALVNGQLRPTMIEARRTEEGVKYFLAGTQTPAEGARPTDDKEVAAAADLAKIGERPEVQKQNEKVISVTSGLRSSGRLQAIVDRDEGVLPKVTGAAVDFIDSTRKEFMAATSLLGIELQKNGDGTIDGTSMEALENRVKGIDVSAITDRAELRDLFNAEMGILAYRMGAAEGQTGNAFSEKDFNRIAAGLSGSTSAEGFKKNLNGYMSGQLRSVTDSGAMLRDTNKQIENFEALYGYNPVGSFPDPESFIASRTLGANGEVLDPELQAGYAAAKSAKPFNGITPEQGTPNTTVKNNPNAPSGRTKSGVSWSIE